MLKKRSSAVCSKQGLMSDHIPLPSPTTKFRNKTTDSSLIPSPGFIESDKASVMSPTSILEAKPFYAAGNHHFFSGRKTCSDSNNSTETKIHPWDVINSQNVGLGILNALSNEKSDKKSPKAETRMVLFGSQLKVQIPSTSSVLSPHSLIEFGVKNKNTKLAMALLSLQRKSFGSSEASTSALCLSPSEMELSEDYTRVVSHGPNPKTVHIFDNCTLRREMKSSMDDDFLAFCQFCRKKLGQGKDIFMYRGEKAFCSHECRSREMLLDDETENSA